MLLERDQQLTVLNDRLRIARDGQGSLVLIGGEAGAGKTSLITEFIASLDVRALIGGCDPLSMPAPLGPLRDFVDVGEGENIDLFRDVLERFGRSPEPTVMVIEDVHWADQATLDFIRFVGRRVGDTSLLVLCTYRDDEVGPQHPFRVVLGQLARVASTVRVTVPMLSIDAVRDLAATTTLDAAALHRLTGGNAFFVTEVIAAGGSPSASLQDAVLARLGGLTPGVRGVIETVSIAPRFLEIRRAMALGSQPADIDAAVGSGVLLASGERLRFRHELARSAVEDAIPPARRHELHRAVLRLLLDEAAPDHARLAHHAIRAHAPELIALHAPTAAREASARSSTREAAALFQAAVEHAGQYSAEDSAMLRLELGAELIGLDRPADALTHIETARRQLAAIGAESQQVDALRQASRAHYAMGRTDVAMDVAREAASLAESHGPSERLVLALNTVAHHAMLVRRASEGRPIARRAAQLARQLELPAALHAVEHTQACLELVGGDTDRGIALLVRSVENSSELSLGSRLLTLSNLGSGAGEVRRYETAIDALVEAEALGIAHDLDASVAYVRAWLARVSFEQGRWDDAVAYASLVDATATNREGYALLTALGVLGRVRVRRGDPGGVAVLEETLAGFDGHALQYRWSPVAGLAEHHWLRDDIDAMVAVLSGPYEEALGTQSEWAMGELGYWMWKAGQIDAPSPQAAAPFAAQMNGQPDRAAGLWNRIGCPYEEALARSDGPGDVAIHALHLLDSLGAEPLAGRVRAELRAAGVGVPRGPSSTTQAHPRGLTGRQAEVLDLIVEGCSNGEIAARLYVSKKTVEHHVSAIFAKLGVERRTQAIAAALTIEN